MCSKSMHLAQNMEEREQSFLLVNLEGRLNYQLYLILCATGKHTFRLPSQGIDCFTF